MRAISLALFATLAFAADDKTAGIEAFERGRYVEAGQRLQAAVKQAPEDAQARAFLALTQAATGQCAAAEPELRAQTSKQSADELPRLTGLALAQCQLAAGNTASALATLSVLQGRYPSDADVLFATARLHMKAFNDTSFQMFQKAPASYRVAQLSAEIFETQGKFSEAVSEYRKAIAKNPAALNLHFRLGRALLLQGHDAKAFGEARKEFEAELALNPEDAAAEFQIGQILIAEGDRAGALIRFDRALSLRPDFAEAFLAAGKTRLEAKQIQEAIPLLERAAVLQPANESAHYSLMLAYRNQGNLEKAKHEQQTLEKLRKPPEGEFTDFLKRLGEKQPQ